MKAKPKKKVITSVRLKCSVYRISRTVDGAGDSGPMLEACTFKDGKVISKTGVIKVGCSVKCGSYHARTMQWQDFWMTTSVKKITGVSKKKDINGRTIMTIKFKTLNSNYILIGY